jgi:hypothetical protein
MERAMNTATQAVEQKVETQSDSERMKEALRRLAAAAGEDVVETVEAFIDDLEETIVAKDDTIRELRSEIEDMIPVDDADEAKREDEAFVRGLASVHRMLKSGELLRGTSELEYYLDRNCDKWRMYVS